MCKSIVQASHKVHKLSVYMICRIIWITKRKQYKKHFCLRNEREANKRDGNGTSL